MQLGRAGEAGGKAELGFQRAAAVEASGEERTRLLCGLGGLGGDDELNPHRAGTDGGGGVVALAGVGDDDANGGLASGEVLALAEDADDWAAQDLRDGFDAFDGGKRAVGVFEAVADALPDDVFKRDGLVRRDGLLPGAIAFVDVQIALGVAEDVVFGVEDFGDELARGSARGAVRDGDRQGAARVGGGKRLGLGMGEREDGSDEENDECER